MLGYLIEAEVTKKTIIVSFHKISSSGMVGFGNQRNPTKKIQ